jgi:hypothetical protein
MPIPKAGELGNLNRQSFYFLARDLDYLFAWRTTCISHLQKSS